MPQQQGFGPGRALAVGLGVIAAAAAVGFVAATAVSTYFARTVLTPPRRKAYDLRILDLDPAAGTITLSANPDSRLPGRYGLWFDQGGGHARLGRVLEESETEVVRVLDSVDYGDLAVGDRARLDGWWYLGPGELGLDYREVEIPGQLGDLPAWHFPASGSTWAITVHGWTAQRAETLRFVAPLHERGMPVLVTSYRNDGDAPSTPDNRYGLGGTEWRDVEAAIRFAIEQGAQRVVLFGMSMGGAVSLQTLLRSSIADRIQAVVLDSPVIDWESTLHYQAESHRLPQPLRHGVFGMMSSSWGRPFTGQHEPVDLVGLRILDRADELNRPILILHSDDDGFVPSAGSRELAALRPDLISFVAFEEARHVKLWNYDEERWTSAIGGWLDDVLALSATAAG